MNAIPSRIFLQWFGDELDPDPGDDVLASEVSWSLERIFDADVEYVRANLLPTVEAQLAEAVELLRRYIELTAPACDKESLDEVDTDARTFLDKVKP